MVLLDLFHNQGRGRPIGGGADTYADKVLGYNPTAYWPLWETSGGVAYDISGNGFHGAYTGVTLGQKITDANGVTFTCPLFDGINDFMNAWSPGFRDAFSGAKGTTAIWFKVSGVGIWTDGNAHKAIRIEVNGSNYLDLGKITVNNRIAFRYKAGGTEEQVLKDGLTTTDWAHLAITWDKPGSGNMIAYYNGVQEGAPLSIAGTWAGDIGATTTLFGASATTPSAVFDGWLAHPQVYDRALAPAGIADLAVV